MTSKERTALQQSLASQQRLLDYYESRGMRIMARKTRVIMVQLENFLTLVGVEATTVNVEAN
jgi:hypothetical protein